MLELFLSLIIFIFGLIVGSFLNCVIYRLEVNDSPLKGKSYCPKCKHTLNWQDLIPVLSFFFLRGKCRYCSQKISWQYPLVEIATGILFLLIFNFQLNPVSLVEVGFLIFYFIIASLLIIIFVYDLKHYIIPDRIIYSAIVLVLFYVLLRPDFFGRSDFFLSAFGAALFFLLLVLITKGKGMGIGDIKLAFFMGLFLGWPNILIALFLAFFIGAIIGTGLIILKKKNLKSEIPFAPFLIFGTFFALFFAEKILEWYWYLFLLL